MQGDKPQPTDFVPENGAPEASITDTIPLCHVCGAAMEPKLDNVGGSVTVAREPVKPVERVRNLPSQPIQTLFTPDPGESILTIKDTATGLVVATNKRIVKVTL